MPNATDAVWLSVLPDMSGFGPAIGKGADAEAAKAGKSAGGKFGKAALAGVAVIAGGAVLATKALYNVGATFDEMSDTIRVGTGASGKAFDGLVASAKRVGRDVPASFEDIGTVLADLNTRLGVTGPTLEKLSKQFLEAGRMLGEEIDVKSVTASFSAFGVEGKQTTVAMDQLFRVSQATGVGMNELAATMSKSGTIAAQLGFNFEETASLVGVLDKAGVNSKAVMASMSAGLVKLAKDGEAPQEAFKRVTGDLQGFIDKGDDAAALNLAGEVFGTRGAGQMIAALKSGKVNLEDMAGAAGMSSDTILDVSKETMDMSEQWQIFKNRALLTIEPVATRVFNALGKGAEWMNTTGTPALKDFGGWVQKNSAWLLPLGAAVTGLAGGLALYSMAVKVTTVVTAAWAKVQALLNGTMTLNPIGLVVVALAALTAALVIAYKKSDTFRAIVDKAWSVTKRAISSAWEGAIKPAFRAFAGFITGTLMPVIRGLWDKVVKPVFKAIGQAINLWWTHYAKPVFQAFKSYLENVLFPVIRFLWSKVVKPVMESMGRGIELAWENVIKPVFQALAGFIEDKIVPGFRRGVAGIKDIWEGLKEVAAKPVRFLVNTVYNNGLRNMINAIPGVDDLPALRLGFAKGGELPAPRIYRRSPAAFFEGAPA